MEQIAGKLKIMVPSWQENSSEELAQHTCRYEIYCPDADPVTITPTSQFIIEQ